MKEYQIWILGYFSLALVVIALVLTLVNLYSEEETIEYSTSVEGFNWTKRNGIINDFHIRRDDGTVITINRSLVREITIKISK